jgi:CO/xanthine dehydrogenase FAD-binding subunit
MRPFIYRAPTSLGEAVALLNAKGKRARPLAGGTDLLVQLRSGLREVDLLIDLKRIPDLNLIEFDPTDGLTVGAAVCCAHLCERPDVRQAYPGLIDATSIIGGTAIQGRATLGGNLCNGAPSGDSIPAMIVLGATCMIVGPRRTRRVAVETFCTGPGRTTLEPDEVLASIHFPPPEPRSGARYLRFTPRREMDLAIAGAAAWVALSEDGALIADARIALGAVAPTPLRVPAAEAALIGKASGGETFAEAASLAREAARPITDVRGTASQRRHLVGVLVARALRDAVRRAKGHHVELGEGGSIYG